MYLKAPKCKICNLFPLFGENIQPKLYNVANPIYYIYICLRSGNYLIPDICFIVPHHCQLLKVTQFIGACKLCLGFIASAANYGWKLSAIDIISLLQTPTDIINN